MVLRGCCEGRNIQVHRFEGLQFVGIEKDCLRVTYEINKKCYDS